MNIPTDQPGMTTYARTFLCDMQFRKCSRLNNDAWQSPCHAGVALNRPTHRGCRAGAHKHRRMSLKRTGSNTSNLLTIRPKPDNQMMPAKLALINARSVRNTVYSAANEYQHCWEGTCDGLASCPGESVQLHSNCLR